MLKRLKKFLSSGKRSGFTLLEMVVFTAIFSVTIVAFIAVLVSITRTQVRQGAAAEVNTQSQYVLQAVQYYVERSSLIELSPDAATTSVKLRMSLAAEDPTLIFASGTAIYSQVGADPAQPLTSSKVSVSNINFIKHSNPPGKDTLAVNFTISYNTQNVQQSFSQALESAVSRVNAATFDTGVYPVTNGSGNNKIGAGGSLWNSINDSIYFSGSNVGIGASSPTQVLEVNGGLRLNTATAKPSCDSNARGTFWVTLGGGGKDSVEVCAQNASSSLAWRTIY